MPSVPRSLTGDEVPTRRRATFPVIPVLLPSLARGGGGGTSLSVTTHDGPVPCVRIGGQWADGGNGCALVDVSIVLSRACKKLGERGR